MIISDDHRFVFVHVPKCAGTSLRHALRAIDSSGGAFRAIGEHPEMGSVHFAHLPLADVARYFPQAFEKVCDYRSMAIVRDPLDRFFSAIFQRLREFGGTGQSAITPEMIEREAAAIIRHLESRPARLDAEHVHFNRQADFIEFDGRQIVRQVFPLERLADAVRWIAQTTGVEIGEERRNRTTEFSISSLRPIQRLLRAPYARLIPAERRTKIREQMARAGFYRDIPKQRFVSPGGVAEQFIRHHYSRDFAIYEHSLERQAHEHA